MPSVVLSQAPKDGSVQNKSSEMHAHCRLKSTATCTFNITISLHQPHRNVLVPASSRGTDFIIVHLLQDRSSRSTVCKSKCAAGVPTDAEGMKQRFEACRFISPHRNIGLVCCGLQSNCKIPALCFLECYTWGVFNHWAGAMLQQGRFCCRAEWWQAARKVSLGSWALLRVLGHATQFQSSARAQPGVNTAETHQCVLGEGIIFVSWILCVCSFSLTAEAWNSGDGWKLNHGGAVCSYRLLTTPCKKINQNPQKPNLDLLIFCFLSHQDVLGSLTFSGSGLERFCSFGFCFAVVPRLCFRQRLVCPLHSNPQIVYFILWNKCGRGKRCWGPALVAVAMKTGSESPGARKCVAGGGWDNSPENLVRLGLPIKSYGGGMGWESVTLGQLWSNCFSLPEPLPVQSDSRGTDVEACRELTLEARSMTIIMTILYPAILSSKLKCSVVG